MLTDMEWFFDNLENGTPFGFARFNDGEMLGIVQVGSVAARGDQLVDEGLSTALKESLTHRQKNYYVGIPCSSPQIKIGKALWIGSHQRLKESVWCG